jgi:hypothetical protein
MEIPAGESRPRLSPQLQDQLDRFLHLPDARRRPRRELPAILLVFILEKAGADAERQSSPADQIDARRDLGEMRRIAVTVTARLLDTRRRQMKKLLLATVATLAFSAGAAAVCSATPARPAVGPSFNCAAPAVATQPLAQLICSSDRIARADLSYVIAYMALRQISNDADRATRGYYCGRAARP